MALVTSPTELTTSVTDAILGVECILILLYLWKNASGNRWRTGLWGWVLGLLAFASFLGAIAHGIEMHNAINNALWKPLYLSLGLVVSLFLAGVFFDWQGRDVAKGIVPWSIGAGVFFYGLTEFFDGAFIVFVIYEAAVMLTAFCIYVFLAATRRLKGAGILAAAIFLNLVAAGIQASDIILNLIVPFDHNGLFHLVQMMAVAILGLGLRMGLSPDVKPEFNKVGNTG